MEQRTSSFNFVFFIRPNFTPNGTWLRFYYVMDNGRERGGERERGEERTRERERGIVGVGERES